MYITAPAKLTQTQREKIVTFLSGHRVGVLATVDPDGNPQASAIYITVDPDLRITFTSKQSTAKYQNIAKHSAVMLVVFDAGSQSEVQVSGKAIVVKDAEAQQEIYRGTLNAAAVTGDDGVPPIAKIPAGNYVGFVIEIEHIMLSEYGWGDTFAQAMERAATPDSSADPA
jgi:general stress protein 26